MIDSVKSEVNFSWDKLFGQISVLLTDNAKDLAAQWVLTSAATRVLVLLVSARLTDSERIVAIQHSVEALRRAPRGQGLEYLEWASEQDQTTTERVENIGKAIDCFLSAYHNTENKFEKATLRAHIASCWVLLGKVAKAQRNYQMAWDEAIIALDECHSEREEAQKTNDAKHHRLARSTGVMCGGLALLGVLPVLPWLGFKLYVAYDLYKELNERDERIPMLDFLESLARLGGPGSPLGITFVGLESRRWRQGRLGLHHA